MLKKIFLAFKNSSFLPLITITVVIVSLIAIYFTYNQVTQEEGSLTSDLQYRSSLLAKSLKESVEPNFIHQSNVYLQSIVTKFIDKQRIAGLAVEDNKGSIIAISPTLQKSWLFSQQMIIGNVMDSDKENGEFATLNKNKVYVFASPLEDKNIVVGALVIVQNANYINSTIWSIIQSNFIHLLVQAVIVALLCLIIIRLIIYDPIKQMTEMLKSARTGSTQQPLHHAISTSLFFKPLAKELAKVRSTLLEARHIASEEAKLNLEKQDSPWTPQRLQEFIKDMAKGRQIFMVSNREPYSHERINNKVSIIPPASGMVSAIEPIMESCGGTWIAFGSGNADREVVDKNDTISVPPEEPKYTLKRVWLTKKEEDGYYNGFCNEALWPLCHRAYTRPIFRKEDWEYYKIANEKFAKALLEEMKDVDHPFVFVQDFHLSLVPRLIKDIRPDATIGIFWHIPWPNAESFSICPWKDEILDGILGADVIGFHTQQHCNNFIETVSRELESLIDLERFTVTRHDHVSYIKPFPISIAFTMHEKNKFTDKEKVDLIKSFGIKTPLIGLGLDRLDYTKGILERLKAIEIFLLSNPEYQEKFTFLQISVPSRTKVKRYQDFREEVQKEADRINEIFGKNNWKPIILSLKQYSHEEVEKIYKIANFCLVSSLHDGMNLVSKEFVAARNDEQGVLILSEFAGASRELQQALIVNPFNGEQTAQAILQALTMSKLEQTKRMRSMREAIKSYNVYKWGAEFIRVLVSLG